MSNSSDDKKQRGKSPQPSLYQQFKADRQHLIEEAETKGFTQALNDWVALHRHKWRPLSNKAKQQVRLHVENLNREFIAYATKHPEILHELTPFQFEELIADVLKDMGCEIQLTPKTRDHGRDILAVFPSPVGKLLTIVECKRYKPQNKIGVDIVERFLYTIDRTDNASCGLIATTSSFSEDVNKIARDLPYKLKLKDFEGIRDWIGRYGKWTTNERIGLWLPD